MNKPSQNLKELGIELPEVTAPLGAYVPAVRTGNLVFVSGQLPLVDGKLIAEGTVGKDLDVETAATTAERCFINILDALKTSGVQVDDIKGVIKLTGYVRSCDDFQLHPQVINGASELCHKIFGDLGRHSRAAVGVNSLPLNSPVELEAIFSI